MKKFGVRLLLVMFSLAAFVPAVAAVLHDAAYQVGESGSASDIVIEQGDLKDASGRLFDPVCIGQSQSPALINDLDAFFLGYETARLIERDNGNYMRIANLEFIAQTKLQPFTSPMLKMYIELDRASPNEGKFILRAPSTFFTESGAASTTCLAGWAYDFNGTHS